MSMIKTINLSKQKYMYMLRIAHIHKSIMDMSSQQTE